MLSKRAKVLLLLAIISCLVAGAVWIYFTSWSHNFAQDAAKPLEDAFIRSGAIKMCDIGDSGHGPDNRQPNYEARFQLNVPKDEATKLINQVVADNGYKLIHTDSPYDSIEWYSDTTSKDSHYTALQTGEIKLGISTYNDTAQKSLTCYSKNSPTGDATHTAISLSIGLPTIK